VQLDIDIIHIITGKEVGIYPTRQGH